MSNSIDATASRDFRDRTRGRRSPSPPCTCRASAKRSFSGPPQEFGFVELDDAFATGSSMMPQKDRIRTRPNWCGARARGSSAIWSRSSHSEKGLPFGYNRGSSRGQGADLRCGGDGPRFRSRRWPALWRRRRSGVDRMRAPSRGHVTATDGRLDFFSPRAACFPRGARDHGSAWSAKRWRARHLPRRAAGGRPTRVSSESRREGARGSRDPEVAIERRSGSALPSLAQSGGRSPRRAKR